MMLAIRHFKIDKGRMFRMAVRNRAELVNVAVGGKTPLMVCVEEGHWTAFVVLLALGGCRETVDDCGNTLLHYAVNS